MAANGELALGEFDENISKKAIVIDSYGNCYFGKGNACMAKDREGEGMHMLASGDVYIG